MNAMWRSPTAHARAALSVAAALLLAGCGSQTKTVTVNGPPAITTSSAQNTTPTQSTPTQTTSTQAATSTGTASTTRTAPEPAFTQKEAETGAEGVSAAAAVLRARGYTPESTAEYHPEQTLRVLVGTRTGSTDGFGQQAFFFLDGRYIGTDTKEPSATVKVLAQSDTEVTLAYPLYRSKDPLCCASAGRAVVHFQLNNGKLTPLERIPPANSKTVPSRY
jgi:LppP/LprE lipoprotein